MGTRAPRQRRSTDSSPALQLHRIHQTASGDAWVIRRDFGEIAMLLDDLKPKFRGSECRAWPRKGSRGEIRSQLYYQFRGGELDGVDLQRVSAG